MFDAKKFAVLIFLYWCPVFSVVQEDIVIKSHEQWWEKNLSTFSEWTGDENIVSRVKARTHIEKKGYKTILDVGCGLCIDFLGYVQSKSVIEYQGLEISQLLVDRAQRMGISVKRGSVEQITFEDSTFDVCYARHLIEHLEYYKKAIAEMVRVAQREVIIVFFIKPTYSSDRIYSEIDRGCQLYYNHYNKLGIEKYLKSLPKVKKFDLWEDADGRWEDVDGKEVILHIYLNQAV